MAEYMVTDTDMKSVADAIRTKGGTATPLAFPDGMKQAITDIPKAKPEQEKTVDAVKNSSVVVTPDDGKTLSKAIVNIKVPSDKKPEQTYTKTYTANGNYPITPDNGKVISGGSIIVNTPTPKPEQAKTVEITENGDITIAPDAGKVLSSVLAKVNVSGSGDVAPFDHITVETWIPASDTNTYTPTNPANLEVMFMFSEQTDNNRTGFKICHLSVVTGKYATIDPNEGYNPQGAGLKYAKYPALESVTYHKENRTVGVKTSSFGAGIPYIVVLCYGPLK